MGGLARLQQMGIVVAATCLVILSALWLIARSATIVEQAFSRGFFPWIVSAQGVLFGWLPFSLAEAVVLMVPPAVCGLLLWWIVVRGRGATDLQIGALVWLIVSAGLVTVATGYLFWGLNYSRPPLRERLGWEIDSPDAALLASASNALIEILNEEHGKGGGERPWAELGASWKHLDQAVNDGIRRASHVLGQSWDPPSGAAKPIALSRGMSYLGISGIYFPWTGEANVNVDVPQIQLPHVTAHEKAHQLGLAAEDEANFVAFVACFNSPDPRLRYSAALFAFQQVAARFPRQRKTTSPWESLSSGVREDLYRIRDYWQAFDGPVERVAARVNDRYLRSQGVREGIQSYSESVNLILSYWKRVEMAEE